MAAYSSGSSWSSYYDASEIESIAGDEYLQIDFLTTVQIAAIGTKGGVDYEEWVTSYKLSYSDDSVSWTWYNNEEILTGNEDTSTEKVNKLISPIIAQYIRIYPMTATYWVGMRLEAYGTYDLNATLPPDYFDTTTPTPTTCMFLMDIHFCHILFISCIKW